MLRDITTVSRACSARQAGLRNRKSLSPLILGALALFVVFSAARTEAVTLAWDANREANLAGYNLYYGPDKGPAQRVNVGKVTSASVTNLSPNVSYYFYVTAYNTAGLESDPSAQVTYTEPGSVTPGGGVTPPPDGSWKSAFGAEGYYIMNFASAPPGYGSVNLSGGNPWTWQSSTTDPAALQKPTSSDRIASCWYAADFFDVQLHFTDGNPHSVTFYCLDWDTSARVQKVEVFDGRTSTLVSSQTISNFSGGLYLQYQFSADAVVRFTRLAGYNAVVSGIFFGGPYVVPSQAATPVISPNGGSFNAAVPVTISSGTSGAAIYYSTDGSDPTTSSVLYTQPVTIQRNTTLKAVAIKAGSTPSAVASATFFVATAGTGGTATFLGSDTTTQGDWQQSYGAAAFELIADWSDQPDSVEITPAGQTQHIWAYSVPDRQALEKVSSPSRIAACWYAPNSFQVGVNLLDGSAHKVSLYCLDWDFGNRSERVDVFDAATGTLLDSRTVSGFTNGTYLSWQASGAVVFKLTRLTGFNAVVSGVFVE